MPKISVIMSIYNEPIAWIKLAIDSILSQTFTNYEFIIVNDKPGREENQELLLEYAERDSRIITVKNEKNIGLTKSLNKALNIAKGEYIARMDADDISLPDRFEKQNTFLDNNENFVAVGSWISFIDEKGDIQDEIVEYETDSNWVKALFLQNSQVSHPTSMYRRIVNGEEVKYNETVRFAQDYSLWVELLQYGDITNIPERLLYYRNSDQQISSSKKEEQHMCAAKAQKKAFSIFKLPTSDSFLNTYFAMTIQNREDLPISEVKKEYCQFFNKVKLTKENSLALEIIYSTYLAYLHKQCKESKIVFYKNTFQNSTIFMLLLGYKLAIHLYQRKNRRNKPAHS